MPLTEDSYICISLGTCTSLKSQQLCCTFPRNRIPALIFMTDFRNLFRELTGNCPLLWAGEIIRPTAAPTARGVGRRMLICQQEWEKTSVIHLWLIALIQQMSEGSREITSSIDLCS